MSGAVIVAAILMPIPQDGFAPIRIDCDVSATRRYGADLKQSESWGTSSYIFLIPYKASVGSEAYYVLTNDDRTWLRTAIISQLSSEDWPSFAVTFGQAPDQMRVESDPNVNGKITFSAFPRLLTDGGGSVEESGVCRITKHNIKAQAQ